MPQESQKALYNREKFVSLPIHLLKKAPWNFKGDDEEKQRKLTERLRRNGIIQNSIVRELGDGYYEYVDGNHRHDSFVELGQTEVFCYNLGPISIEQAKRQAVEMQEAFEADPLKLKELLDELSIIFPDLENTIPQDMEALEIEVASLYPTEAENLNIEEVEAPELREETFSKPGDIFQLGRHRVMCGDSTSAETFNALMDGKQADMVLTDPPYGVSYVGGTKDALTIENDDLSEEGLRDLMKKAFDNCETHSRGGAYWYASVPGGPLNIVFQDDWHKRGILRQSLVWVKNSLVMGRSEYHYRHEPILFGWKPGGKRHDNPDRTRDTVWEFDKPLANKDHPTMKPVGLWARAIVDGSRGEEVVLDPFLGSGTSVIASEQTGRTCYGLELDPRYCDVVVRRYVRYMLDKGKSPVVLKNGEEIGNVEDL